MKTALRVLALSWGLLLLAPPALARATAEDVAAPPQRTTGFVAAKTPTTIPGGPLLLSAYAVVWTLLFGYVFSVRRRQQEVEDELRELLGEVKELRTAALEGKTAAAPAATSTPAAEAAEETPGDADG